MGIKTGFTASNRSALCRLTCPETSAGEDVPLRSLILANLSGLVNARMNGSMSMGKETGKIT